MKTFALLLLLLVLFSCARTDLAVTEPAAPATAPAAVQAQPRESEADKLCRLGLEQNPAHIAIFLQTLTSPDVSIRESAMAQLLFTHDESAVQPIIAAMTDESRLVRRLAIATLEKMAAKAAIPALRDALKFNPPPAIIPRRRRSSMEWEEYFNRIAAAQALYRLGDDTGKATILDILKTGTEKPVISMAINAAILMGMKEALPECMRIAKECTAFGEDTHGTFALRAIRILGEGDESIADEVTSLALEKYQAPGGFSKFEALGVVAKCGNARGLEIARQHLSEKNGTEEADYFAIEAIERLKPEDAAPFIVKYKLSTERTWCLLSVLRAAEAVARLGDKSVIPDLKKAYASYGGEAKADYFVFRLNVAWVLAELGDEEGLTHLQEALANPDVGVRRLGAQLLQKTTAVSMNVRNVLSQALKDETEPATFQIIHESLKHAGGSPEELAVKAPPEPPMPKDTYNKPRLMTFAFDDCATIESMERLTGLVEELAEQKIRLVFTLNYAPLSRYDWEYCNALVQRLFDRGCEIENHTLHHNPDGRDLMASTDDELRADFSGCNNWLRSHVKGLDKIYTWKYPGGGFRRPDQPQRSWPDLDKIKREALFDTDISLKLPESVPKFFVDLYGPPDMGRNNRNAAGEPVGLMSYFDTSDLKHAFNFAPEFGIRAYSESFDYCYFNQPNFIFYLSGHDWSNGAVPIRPGHAHHWEIFSGFIKQVLVERRTRYPLASCVTELELAYIFNKNVPLEALLQRTKHLQSR